MQAHIASVRSRRIAWDVREVVQHGLNSDVIKLDLDAEWRECDAISVVLCDSSLREPKRFVVNGDRTLELPPSMLSETGPFSTCVIGYKGGVQRIVTAQERYPLVVVGSGCTGPLDPGEEQPDLWGQLMLAEAARIEAELARESAEKARADAEAKRIAAEKARETASAEAVKAANEAAAKAEQAARQAEDRVTAALAEVAEAEQARTEAEKARAAAESSRAEAEAARIAAESKRESAEAKRKADSAKAVADASAATSAANAAAGKADAAAQAATDGEASRVAAETARAKAEQARETAEAGRVEAEKVRVTADAERGRHVDASVKKADAATAEATEAAGKATASATEADAAAKRADEAAKGASENVLVGTETATVVHVEDAWPTLLRECKVLGKSEQTVTTGKNLLGGERYVFGYNIRGFKNILKPNTQYTYSSSGITDGKAAFRLLAFNAQQSKGIGLTVGYIKNASETFTTPENIGEFEELYLGGNYNDAGKNCINNFFQIEEGAKATAYEPYTGGKPSPSPDYPQEITNLTKAELVVAGKNLINPNRLAQNNSVCYSAVDGQLKVIMSDNFAWGDVPIYGTLQAGTYTLSGDNIEIRDAALNQIVNIMSTQVKQFTLNNPTVIKMKIGYGWPKYPVITKAQLEVGSKATAYEPHKSKSTVIDLQGNELCSLPNGVKDEVVIDAEGNVSLIKRVGVKTFFGADDENWIQGGSTEKVQAFNTMALSSTYKASANRYCNLLPFTNEKDTEYIAIDGVGKTYVSLNKARTPTLAEFKSFLSQNPLTVIYEMKTEPQTIPLGKVELPALPESTSNVWNNGNIPANVYINYLKDVNIAFADLESKLTQAVVAAAANL